MGTVYPLQYCSWVWPKLIFLSCSLTICSFNLTALAAPSIPIEVLKDASLVPLCIFQWQKLSQLSVLLIVNLDRPLHTSGLQMRQQTHEVRFYPSLCWSIFYRCLCKLQLEVVSSISGILLCYEAAIRFPIVVHSKSRCLSEVVSCEHWTEQTVRSVRILKRPETESSSGLQVFQFPCSYLCTLEVYHQ